jgi:hypothetical protein
MKEIVDRIIDWGIAKATIKEGKMAHGLDTTRERKESQEGINGWHGEKKERESYLDQILYIRLYAVICAAPLVIVLFSELNYFCKLFLDDHLIANVGSSVN